MKKSVLSIICTALVCIILIPAAWAGNQSPLEVKIATLAPKGTASAKVLGQLAKEVAKVTNNEIKLKVYYGAVQGDDKDVIRKIRFKQLQGATLNSYGLGMIVPEVRITGIPYVYRNYDEVRYVRAKLDDYMRKAFEKKGYVILGWYDIGFVYSFSKVPITSIEIAREQKFWAPEGDLLAQTAYNVLGISPVSLSITDVLTSLSTRMIDAASAPPLAAVAFRWYSRFQYMNEYPSTNVLGATVITKETWDKVSPENQKKLMALSKKYCDIIQGVHEEENKKSINVLKKSGIKIVRIKDAEGYKEFIQSTAEKTKKALVGKMFSQELLDRSIALLKEYREAHPDSAVEKIN